MRRFKDLTKEEKREYILLLFLLPPIFFWDRLKLALKSRTFYKRAIAVCLAVVMVAVMFPATAFAAEVTESINWAVVQNGSDVILYLGSDTLDLQGATTTESGSHNMIFSKAEDRPYKSYAGTITKVIIESQITPQSCAHWFSGFTACTSIEGLDKLDTSQTTSMASMFYNCSKLTSLDVSKFNTSSVTSMSYMFNNCSKLTSLDVSKFNTSSVTNMSYMFSNCSKLTSLDVSNFDTSNVELMGSMFSGCSGLTSLDLSKFNTSSVTSMSYMFSWSNNLTGITFGAEFDTAEVTNMSYMFSNCKGLTSLDLSSFNTSKVTNMSNMFNNCGKLTSLDLSGFNTSSVQYMSNMFYGCSGLNTIKTPATNALEIALPSSNYAIDGQTYDSKPAESKLPTTTGESKTLRRVYDISYTMNDGTNNSANPTYFLYSDDSQTITLTDPTKENYTFTGWSSNTSGVTVNGNEITIPAKQASNVTITANFNINQYTVSVTADPTKSGTVSGGGTYNYNTSVTVTATANTGYRFVNWTENGTQVSTDASYTFTATDARNLVANFELITYTVTWKNYDNSVLETDTGVVHGSTPTYDGDTPAKPEDEEFTYTFNGWSPAVSAVTGDTVYTAQYTAVSKRVEPAYTVTIPATVNEGESITVKATEVVLNTDETLTVTLQSDFKFKNEQGAQLAFKINDGNIGNNAVVLSITGNGDKNNPLAKDSAPLTVKVTEEAKYSGTYTGTITFTIAVNSAVNN